MNASDPRSLGASGVTVTALGLGCAPLGNLFSPVTDEDAASTVAAAWDVGVRLFDTAPLYGSGLSELRLGAGLAGRQGATVASKVGRLLDDDLSPDPIFVDVPDRGPRFDYSAAGVEASLTSSLERLGIDRLDVCWVHDPDDHEAAATTQAFPALRALQRDGRVGAIGAGMNQAEMLTRFVRAGLVDAVLIAGQYNLLDQHAADELLPASAAAGTGVVVGGVYGSGLLADPWGDHVHYRYGQAPPAITQRARAMHRVCEQHGVPLLAPAIQFPLRHPAVSSVVVGARSADEVRANVSAFETTVPDELWADLVSEGLLDEAVVYPS